jgi:hypothetical protein
MSTILRAGINSKGGRDFGDASYRTAFLRKQAIQKGQYQKTGNPATSMSAEAQLKKPLISEHHLTKGFDNGVKEFILMKNKDGFF